MNAQSPTRDPSARTRIVAAAARVATDSGAAHLTIDAVASEAGLSKGGVLYHFPNKRALLLGMLDALVESSTARTSTFAAQLGTVPGASLQAHIKAENAVTDTERAMSMALLTAAAEDPELIGPARGYLAQAFAAVREDARDADLATVLLLATEGLRFLGMLNLLPIGQRDLARLHGRMLALAAGDVK